MVKHAMSRDSDDKSVRRYGQRNRKRSLPPTQPLFPPEEPPEENDAPPPAEAAAEQIGFDVDSLPLQDSDDEEALASLAALHEQFRPPLITPEEERFPPIKPQQAKPQTPPTTAQAKPKRQRHVGYNLLTVLSFCGIVAAVVWTATVWNDPETLLNPFPPPTPFVQVTVTPSGQQAAQPLPTPDETGQIIVIATETAAPAPPRVDMRDTVFGLREGVIYIANGNGLGCDWSSIAGSVSAADGSAINGYRVRIMGNGLDETVFSGAALTFGAGGFELPLLGSPVQAEYSVQLLSPQGTPVSEVLTLTTRSDCDGNVALLNFVPVR